MTELYTYKERNSLRFYQGDFTHYEICTREDADKYNAEFYHAKGSYNILNMLLYPGIDNEYTRMCLEKKEVPIGLLQNFGELLCIYENIFAVMKKFRDSIRDKTKNYYLYRKDRMQSMVMLEAGYTFGFTACSLADTIDPFFTKKDGILLLELNVPSDIPHVCLNDVLGKNKYENQKEILLPPFITFSKEIRPLTKEEFTYRDMNDEAPKAKYYLEILGVLPREISSFDNDILHEDRLGQVVEILHKLRNDGNISEKDMNLYCNWKKQVQNAINKIFWDVINSK